ncbi:MAG: Asparagine synthetase [glutamine-hydrolyzing] (EC [uncultured Sulfurovum sp.]|uniref:asparagine synthase (glutamine-hydrolyzing) n=1 Tax=uncultured Sulfurovum sp. TaxID=269237 RepID=A0A6S6TDQ1_9BACT|nr:MAG: Asparagine synthetase [glutamine-hydrolyzing] (EC [uncultured Sulfurovum sp.]
MKKFLINMSKERKTIKIIEKSNEVETFNNKEIFLLFVGELLNRKKILTMLNLDDKTTLNITLLLASYKKWGIKLLNMLEGQFSLIIHNKNTNTLYIAKDKIGIQPLYFTSMNNTISIGSHVKEFYKVDEIQLSINPNALANYLQFGYILQPQTIFKECYKVQSGEYITFDLIKNNKQKTKYWLLESIYNEKKIVQNESIILNTTHNLLQKSVEENRLTNNHGLSLSGGYDSSTLVAITQQQSEKKIDTFTIGFHENTINEAPHAKAISDYLGTNHHEYYFTAMDALKFIPKMSKVYDEPFADHAASPTMLTAKLLKEHNIKNLIAGDGGDEVFATAEDVHFFNKIATTPTFLKKLSSLPLEYIYIDKVPFLKNYNNLPKKLDKLKGVLNAKNIAHMIQVRNSIFLEKELKQHIKDYNQPIVTSFDAITFGEHSETVDEIIGTYFKTTMTDGELVKSYAAMNHQGITLSTPFLNVNLIQYMAKVPASIKIKNGIKKYLLKEISHLYLPKKLMDRPKCGFSIPLSSWMKNELKDILYSQINKKRLDEDNIFNSSSIINIRNQFYAGNEAYKYKLWRIFIFQLWYENFTININKG